MEKMWETTKRKKAALRIKAKKKLPITGSFFLCPPQLGGVALRLGTVGVVSEMAGDVLNLIGNVLGRSLRRLLLGLGGLLLSSALSELGIEHGLAGLLGTLQGDSVDLAVVLEVGAESLLRVDHLLASLLGILDAAGGSGNHAVSVILLHALGGLLTDQSGDGHHLADGLRVAALDVHDLIIQLVLKTRFRDLGTREGAEIDETIDVTVIVQPAPDHLGDLLPVGDCHEVLRHSRELGRAKGADECRVVAGHERTTGEDLTLDGGHQQDRDSEADAGDEDAIRNVEVGSGVVALLEDVGDKHNDFLSALIALSNYFVWNLSCGLLLTCRRYVRRT